MTCRHVLRDGNRCSRRQESGSRYCWQHRLDARYEAEAARNIGFRPLRVTPTSPLVTPTFIANLIAHTALDIEAKRTFAQEFCEAYQAVDAEFTAAGFMHMALMMPSVTRP